MDDDNILWLRIRDHEKQNIPQWLHAQYPQHVGGLLQRRRKEENKESFSP